MARFSGTTLMLLFFVSFSFSDDITVSQRTLNFTFENNHQDIELNWPVVSRLKDPILQEKINQRLFQFFLGDESIPQASGELTIPKENLDRDIINRYEYILRFDTHYNQNGLLCIEKLAYIYTGGAHGNTIWDFRLFDLTNGATVLLKDILTANHSQKLNDLINKHVPRENLFEPEKPVDCKDSTGWYITNDAFVVHFPLYSIAPYSSGPINVKIPYSEMKDIIKKAGMLKIPAFQTDIPSEWLHNN